MRRQSEAIKADVRRRMGPPHRQSVAQISVELGIHVVILYNWRKTWGLLGEVVPAGEPPISSRWLWRPLWGSPGFQDKSIGVTP